MGWYETLKSKTKDFTLGVAGKAVAQPKEPRDLVLQAIDDSIAYLKDPKYRVGSGRRKGQTPDLVYSINGSQATVSLKYYRARLRLDGQHNTLTIAKSHLPDALNALREGVANGEFDAHLNRIKASRKAKAKVGKPKNGV